MINDLRKTFEMPGTVMLFDTHCHLSLLEGGGNDTLSIIQRAREWGVLSILDISVGTGDFLKRRCLVEKIPAEIGVEVFMTAGIPPFYAGRRAECDIDEVKRQAELLERVIAVGEIGLDYFHDFGSRAEQVSLFNDQLDLANELELPVVVHSRDSDEDLIEALAGHRPVRGGIMHCFSSGVETARRLLDMGFFLSFAGNVTYNRSDRIREAARFVPSDRYCIETDAPYLAPGKYRGKVNEPAYCVITAEFLAGVRKVGFDTLAEETTRNAKSALGL